MSKEEMKDRYSTLEEPGREKLLEEMIFCCFADDWDFENYFKISQLTEGELDCLISFLYQQDCFLMLADILNKYPESFSVHSRELLNEIDFSDRLSARFPRLDAFAQSQYKP